MKSGVNFYTPIVVLIGVLILIALSFDKYDEALNGLISEPILYSSGFLTCIFSNFLLLLNSYKVESRFVLSFLGQLLGFFFGVFVTSIISLFIWTSYQFTTGTFCIIALSTVLVFMPNVAYRARKSERTRTCVSRCIKDTTEKKVEDWSKIIGWVGLVAFFIAYVIFWFNYEWVTV